MFRLFITALACLINMIAFGQCIPDYPFETGEIGIANNYEFENGEIGVYYSDVIHFLLPEFASDLDPTYPPGIPNVRLV